jgi:hypothetical protein
VGDVNVACKGQVSILATSFLLEICCFCCMIKFAE